MERASRFLSGELTHVGDSTMTAISDIQLVPEQAPFHRAIHVRTGSLEPLMQVRTVSGLALHLHVAVICAQNAHSSAAPECSAPDTLAACTAKDRICSAEGWPRPTHCSLCKGQII